MPWQIRKYFIDRVTTVETEHPASPITGFATWQEAADAAVNHPVEGSEKAMRDGISAHALTPDNLTSGVLKWITRTDAGGNTTLALNFRDETDNEWIIWEVSEV